MGEVFARKVLGLEQPSVALLNVGEEHLKGNHAVKKAAEVLQHSDLAIRFHGFVEGTDIGAGTVDVIVTDGFTGNIALKTAEGTSRLLTHFLREALASGGWRTRLGALLARPALREMRRHASIRATTTAPMFLGLNGICVKSHGGTDALGFSNAIRVAVRLIADRVNQGIKDDFLYLAGQSPSRSADRNRLMTGARSRILGCGSYLPARVLTNDELAGQIETSDDWIVTRTGIKRRHIAADGELTSDLGAEAARRALAHAGITAESVDLIVVATSTPDDTFPATADPGAGQARHHRRRRLRRRRRSAPASSSPWPSPTISSAPGRRETALVIGAETYSRILDWEDRGTCVLFGDGAGAVVLTRTTEVAGPAANGQPRRSSPPTCIPTAATATSSTSTAAPRAPARSASSGCRAARSSATPSPALAQVADEALAANGLAIADIDWLIPHQANKRILEGVARKLLGAHRAGDLTVDPRQHLRRLDPAGPRRRRSRRPDQRRRPHPVRGHRRRPDLGRGAGPLVARRRHFRSSLHPLDIDRFPPPL